ncbi:MAG: NUDIX domain-containing protein [Blastocatellia bacterium]
MEIQNAERLNNWLTQREIDTSAWGIGVAKSVEDLWAEIVNGESLLESTPLLRVVQVVNVIIRKNDKVLIETEQQFNGNQTRNRDIPLSEKLKPGEDQIYAALRGIKEELQVGAEQVEILKHSEKPRAELTESPSFPGLQTKYLLHTVEVRIENLPDETFWTDEAPENDSDPVTRHQWQWKVVAQ